MKNKDFIKWKELSRELSGSDNSIRQNNIPKKYKEQVERLDNIIELWRNWSKNYNKM